ncbi:MAG: uncharacterized protein JWQ18_2957, partial [Conexibacter sp.]|nr:uncharacterized protein [Conexibacter sp.]
AAFQTAELAATDATTYDYLGSSVATDGSTIVGGAPGAGSLSYGAAYVYTKPSGGWVSATQTARLTGSDTASDDSYAYAVAVSGSTVAVGSPYAQSGKGAVYTYKKPGGGWADTGQTAKLTSSPQITGESLGGSLAIEGTTLVVGAPNNYNPGSALPSVYVFEQPGAGWTGSVTSSVRLTQTDNTSADHFGTSVSISGTTITASSPFTPGTASGTSGGFYVFTRPGATWASTSTSTKVSGPADGNVQQADWAAVSGTTVVSSARYAKVGSNNEQGAAYVFDTAGAGPGTGDGGGGGTTTPPPTTTPIPTPAPPAANATISFVPTVTRVPNDIGWGDIAANLLGIKPGSGATSNWGEFTFIAVCHQADGCTGTITFGAQKPAPGATTRAVTAKAKAKPKKAPAPYAKSSFSLKSGQQRTLTIKLSSAARKLGKKKKSLTGYVTVTIKRPGTTAEVLTHKLTLKVAPKKKAKK